MKNRQWNFTDNLRKYLIVSGVIFLIGIIFLFIFGVSLDINFKGGSRFTYVYTGEVDPAAAQTAIETAIGKSVNVSESTDITGESNKLNVSLIADESLSTESQQLITDTLAEKFPDNNITLGDSNTVDPSVAGSFFAKALYAVALAAIFVIIYLGLRFRKIGGVSAGIAALFALVHDVLIAFFVCVIFRLQIDTNFMAVILTILGYSLNDTIVIYDRVRENKRLYPEYSVRQNVNISLNQCLNRTITTSLTTFIAIMTIIVVAEFAGLSTLRSFAIPMAIGIVSGCYSSLCLSGPLWVRWCEYRQAHPGKKAQTKKRRA